MRVRVGLVGALGVAALVVGASSAGTAGAVAPLPPPTCQLGTTSHSNPSVVPIADLAVVTSTIDVTGVEGIVYDVDVVTNLVHSFPDDLDVTLTSPEGTVVTLTTDNASSYADVFNGTVWDDDADPGGQVLYADNPGLVTDRLYDYGVVAPTLVPEEALGAFIGENPNGTWTLAVSDDVGGDVGELRGWSLELTTLTGDLTTYALPLAVNDLATAIPDAFLMVSQVQVPPTALSIIDVNVGTEITHTWANDLDITVESPAGTVVTLTTDNAGSADDVFNGTWWDDDADPGSPVPYVGSPNLVTDYAYTDGIPASPLVPEEALAAFVGENPSGVWSLTVADDSPGSTGILHRWGVSITVASCAASNSTPLPPLPSDPAPGVPGVPGSSAGVEVVAGEDRVATGVAVSRASFGDGAAGGVVLARRDGFADALAGTPFAAAVGGPLLLTSSGGLDAVVEAEVRRVVPAGGRVFVLGGSDAIGDGVVARLVELGFAVERVAGPDRFATAVAVAEALGSPPVVLEASGRDFPDAVSAGAAAVVAGGAVLLTDGGVQSAATAAYLDAHPGVARFAVGGPAAAADPGATGLVGFDRFHTSALVAQRFFPSPTVAGVASGRAFPDALTGGVYVGVRGGPMLLTEPGELPAPVGDVLRANAGSIDRVVIFGGPAAVGASVAQAAATAIT